MKNALTAIVISIHMTMTFTSCNSNVNENTEINSGSKHSMTDTVLNTSSAEDFEPGISLFCYFFDSLLRRNVSNASTYRIDTITAENTDYRDSRSILFTSNKVFAKKHTLQYPFDNINIVEASYPNGLYTAEVFHLIRNESKKPFGLSGGRDFVIKSDNKIYWLMSSPCLSDFKTLKYLMTKAWSIKAIQDSINYVSKNK